MSEDIQKKTTSKRYEVTTIFEGHSESTYLIRRKGAEKLFEEKKEQFKTNKDIKEITFSIMTMKNDDIKTELLERVKREEIL